MSKTLFSRIKSQKILSFVALLAVIIAVIGIVSVVRAPGSDEGGPSDSTKITKTGTVVCLPHKNTDGPQTLECAMGLKTEDNKHYALNDEDASTGDSPINGVFNKRVEVTGVLTQTDDTIYDIVGTITITKLKVVQ